MNDEATDRLFSQYFEATSTAEDRAELAARLAESPGLRRRFLREARVRTEIRRWAKAEQSRVSDEGIVPALTVLHGRRRRRITRVPMHSADRPAAHRGLAPRRRWIEPLAVAAVALAIVGAVRFLRPRMAARQALAVVQEPGSSTVCRGQVRIAARPGTPLRIGDQIVVGVDGALSFAYRGERTRITAAPETALRLTDSPAGKRIDLDVGRIEAEVGRRAPGNPLVLFTTHAVAEVLGTRFTLEALPDRTRLEVRKGLVRLTRLADRQAVHVGPGQFAVAGAGYALAATAIRHAAPQAAGRSNRGLTALYLFNEATGRKIRDRSGVGRPLDLQIPEPHAVRWLRGGGLRIMSPTLIVSQGPAAKITDACKASGEFAVEAWVRPHNAAQTGPARIVTISHGHHRHMNVMLGQLADALSLRMRLSTARAAGYQWRELHTAPGTVRARLIHIAYVRAVSGIVSCYIDGRPVGLLHDGLVTPRAVVPVPGELSVWERTLELALADEPGDRRRAFLGDYHLVALYSTALTPAEVGRNYRAGPHVSAPGTTSKRVP